MGSSIIDELRTIFGENRVRIDEPMGLHTALRVGGPAFLYLEVERADQLFKAVEIAKKANTPYVVIGSGSKTLFSDTGYHGLVIKNNSRKFDVLSRKGKIRNNEINVDRAYVYADGGAVLNQVVRFAIEQGYAGLEKMLGVPGTVAGSLFTPEVVEEFAEVIYQIQAYSGEGKLMQVTESDLIYRDTKGALRKGGYLVTSVVFELFPGHTATLWEKGTEALERRNAHKPNLPLSYRAFSDITISEAMSIPTPKYTRDASYLLEKADLGGMRAGGAMLSQDNPNFLQNVGDATGDDMITVLRQSAERVKKKFGITLRPAFTII